MTDKASHPTWVRGLKPHWYTYADAGRVSHPTWVRGLKPYKLHSSCHYQVAPYVGAWIETKSSASINLLSLVAPYVGAWIETSLTRMINTIKAVAPYVGAWIETLYSNGEFWLLFVAPYVGAWIETEDGANLRNKTIRRTLRGCVD